jgi:hypothetical protein
VDAITATTASVPPPFGLNATVTDGSAIAGDATRARSRARRVSKSRICLPIYRFGQQSDLRINVIRWRFLTLAKTLCNLFDGELVAAGKAFVASCN